MAQVGCMKMDRFVFISKELNFVPIKSIAVSYFCSPANNVKFDLFDIYIYNKKKENIKLKLSNVAANPSCGRRKWSPLSSNISGRGERKREREKKGKRR